MTQQVYFEKIEPDEMEVLLGTYFGDKKVYVLVYLYNKMEYYITL